MGLSEQARGTAQATVTGLAGPIPVPPQIPDIISQQPALIVPGLGAANFVQAAVPGGSEAGRPRNLLKLLPYNGEESLETFLAKFDYMAKYLKWKETDKFFHLCSSLEGPAGQVLWGLKPDATAVHDSETSFRLNDSAQNCAPDDAVVENHSNRYILTSCEWWHWLILLRCQT